METVKEAAQMLLGVVGPVLLIIAVVVIGYSWLCTRQWMALRRDGNTDAAAVKAKEEMMEALSTARIIVISLGLVTVLLWLMGAHQAVKELWLLLAYITGFMGAVVTADIVIEGWKARQR